ncbi:MAG: WD40 repeat domain-containing protein [Anaerolineaceae bacterium]
MKKAFVCFLIFSIMLGISACATNPASTQLDSVTKPSISTEIPIPTATATVASMDLSTITDDLKVEQVKEIQTSTEWIKSLALSPDGTTLAYSYDKVNTIHLFDVTSGQDIGILEGHSAPVANLAFSPDGTMLASANTSMDKPNNSIHLWNVQSKTQLAVLENAGVYNLVFSPDGKMLAGEGSGIQIWSTPDLSPIHVVDAGSGRVAFSPDDKALGVAMNNDGLVHLLDVTSWAETTLPALNNSPIWVLAYSQTGNQLAVGSEDNLIVILNSLTGESLATMTGHAGNTTDILFSPQGNLLASLGSGVKMSTAGGRFTATRVGEDRFVRFWNVKTGDQIGSIKADGEIIEMGFSQDWSVIATGDSNGFVRIWKIVQ